RSPVAGEPQSPKFARQAIDLAAKFLAGRSPRRWLSLRFSACSAAAAERRRPVCILPFYAAEEAGDGRERRFHRSAGGFRAGRLARPTREKRGRMAHVDAEPV